MTGSLLWLALAASITIWPSASSRQRPPARRRRRPPDRARGLAAVAALSVGAFGVALFGIGRGLVLAVVAGPVVAAAVARSAAARSAGGGVAGLPFALDLGAAVLQCGAPVSVALEQAAPAAGGELADQLVHAARLLRLGAGPAEAWRSLADDPRLSALAAVSRRSASSGIRLAAAWEQLAAELRAERRSQALSRAHRAGVFAMAPLGLCFLPAFVCLGVIPDVLGMARDVLVARVEGP